MSNQIDRRKMLVVSAGAVAGAAIANATVGNPAVAGTRPLTANRTLVKNESDDPFSKIKYCLNMSTVREQKLTLPEQVNLAAGAGYDAIEPWIPELRKHDESHPGALKDLSKILGDSGITIESAIGFARWIVDDDAARAKGLEEAKRDMDLISQLGGTRIAAPPVGAHKKAGPTLPVIAKRYHALLEVGREMGVTPQLELWGFSKTLSRLGELAYVAAECGHPDACVLPDVYHIYKGGSDFAGLNMIEASRMKVFHMNDYPAEPKREEIGDKDRVYPGDGVAPLKQIIGGLVANGFEGFFSLELFNPEYWKQDAMVVAKTGLRKMKDAVANAKP